MKALLQRVNHASVTIDGAEHARIGRGLLLLLGLDREDSHAQGEKLLGRVLDYRVFNDAQGRMNLSLRDIGGDLLLVSQFTLAADTSRGLRPGFSTAMAPVQAEALYNDLVIWLRNNYPNVATGSFGADMKVSLENDGPVTFLL
jgi:D-aminoacyl-tRNA deacylase